MNLLPPLQDKKSSVGEYALIGIIVEMLVANEILNDTWIVTKRVGKGSFCELYAAYDFTTKSESDSLVAIKIQSASIDEHVLRWEADVIKALSDSSLFPKFVFVDVHQTLKSRHCFLVMEFLGGDDMSKLRDRIK